MWIPPWLELMLCPQDKGVRNMIQQHHVDELKRIIWEEQHEQLSDEEAWEMAHRLYNLFRLLLDGVVEDEDDQKLSSEDPAKH